MIYFGIYFLLAAVTYVLALHTVRDMNSYGIDEVDKVFCACMSVFWPAMWGIAALMWAGDQIERCFKSNE